MKGGKTPIHIMRWAPADFLCDPFVQMLLANGMWETYVFYRQFIDVSFMEGGQVRDDGRLLAALSGLTEDVAAGALDTCVEAGKLVRNDGWIYHQRVIREIDREMSFRTDQSNASRTRSEAVRLEQARTAGQRSAVSRAAKYGSAQPFPRTRTSGSNVHPNVPPSPAPAPAPAPAPTTNNGKRIAALPRGDVQAHAVAWSREACDAWITRFGGTAPGGLIGKSLKPLVDRHGWDAVRAAWSSYLAQVEAEYASPHRFASTYGRWSGTEPTPTSRPAAMVENNRAVLERFVKAGEGEA